MELKQTCVFYIFAFRISESLLFIDKSENI